MNREMNGLMCICMDGHMGEMGKQGLQSLYDTYILLSCDDAQCKIPAFHIFFYILLTDTVDSLLIVKSDVMTYCLPIQSISLPL